MRQLVTRTLHPIPSEFPYIWGKFSFLFYQCRHRYLNERLVTGVNDTGSNLIASVTYTGDQHCQIEPWVKHQSTCICVKCLPRESIKNRTVHKKEKIQKTPSFKKYEHFFCADVFPFATCVNDTNDQPWVVKIFTNLLKLMNRAIVSTRGTRLDD
jgi:hypothetical protein